MKLMRKKHCLCLVFTFVTVYTLRADSPLTSVFPAVAYKDVAIVRNEMEADKKELSPEECEFLFSLNNPLDQKFAFINALGWGDTTRVETYINFLMKKYDLPHAVFDSLFTWRGNQTVAYEPAQKLSADDYCCLAYLQANGNYFAPLKGYYCAYRAVDMKGGSEAAAYVYGLILAQFFLDNDWCQVYKVMNNIKNFENYTSDRLREEAIKNIFEYIDIYESSCGKANENANGNYYNKPVQPQKMEDKNNYVDLEVVEITAPEYNDDIKGAIVHVKIKNKGTLSSIETNAKLMDLDITAAEAKKRKFPKLWINAIKENNANATNDQAPDEQKGIDSDKFWEVFVKIPVLQPGETYELKFEIKDYWIYDPNCEMELFLDFDQNIEEKNETNNVKAFVAWG